MGVELRCVDCGTETVSAMFWRGSGQHGCRSCGGQLALTALEDDRRSGVDRRRRRFLRRWPDWRSGGDRRAAVPDDVRTAQLTG